MIALRPTLALVFALDIALLGCGGSAENRSPDPQGGQGGDVEDPMGGKGGEAGQGGRGGRGGSGGTAGTGGPGGTGGGTGGTAGAGAGGSAGTMGSPDAAAMPAPDGGAAGAGGTGGMPTEPTGPVETDLTKHKYSKTITMDTTAAGAGVMAEVKSYPVAVLLNAQNFDFAQAMPNGEDVRFALADGKLLPYQIELWDAAGKKAALWVLTDVKGNSNAQSFVMHWGNPGATSAASSKSVFNKEAGFLGVYHLNEMGNAEMGGYKDSSWNEVHGNGVKLPADARVDARVGHGTRFDNPKGGATAMIKWIEVAGPKVTKDFGAEMHPIAISVWAYANSWGGYYETIFSKGDGEYTLQRDYMGRTESCMSPTSGPYHQCAIFGAPPTKVWSHYMVLRTNGPYASNQLTVFMNGRRVAGTTAGGRHVDANFGIANQSSRGSERNQRGFDGILDEVRVMSVVRTADWAKLDYESQRDGAKFLSYGMTMTK